MTDRLPPLATQIVAPSQTVFPVHYPASVPGPAELKTQETAEDEEHNTIKCICDFSDDDGQTIFCETCLTWQHIACYYPGHEQEALRVDFSHSCVDCKPRSLDFSRAREHQRARLSVSVVEEVTDRKPKRHPTKSHKKKPRPSELQIQHGNSTNHHEHTKHSASHDHGQAPKKPKSSHRTSQSISSQAPKRSPSYGNSKPNPAPPPSPATTPPELPLIVQPKHYSASFISSYDQEAQVVDVNSYKGLAVSNTMSLWLRDQDSLLRDTERDFNDVFQKMPPDIESIKHFRLIERKRRPVHTADAVVNQGYLAAVSAIRKDVPLVELNGEIGFQKDYCEEQTHRWSDFSTPLPFVFFHPTLPLFIDTRHEGSKARYVRKSCKPNSVVDTFISEGSEYHFWLVSERPIAAEEQITIPWDFRFPVKERSALLQLFGFGDDEASSHAEIDIDDQTYETFAIWASLLLAEYGGCACDLGLACAFARFQRTYLSRVQSRSNLQHTNTSNAQKKKARKPQSQHTISPTSTGHATTSRAASEGRLEDVTDRDVRSQSSASRSKPPSRDMTPARQGSFDTLGILTEPTDRDKRKVAMVEDSFRRMEQQQPPRKKKRTSDGTGSSRAKSISNSTGERLPNAPAERRYVDAGTSRSKSHSDSTAASPHIVDFVRSASSRRDSTHVPDRHAPDSPRSNYCDAAIQTDPVEGEWYSEIQPTPKPKRRVISLSKRLLNSRHQSRLDEKERRKQSSSQGSTTPMDIDSPTLAQGHVASPSSGNDLLKQGETTSSALSSPRDGRMLESRVDNKHVGVTLGKPLNLKSPDLRVQMPPVPAFGNPTSYLSSGQTPLSATSPMAQSPFASNGLPSPFGPYFANHLAATASPVKKKMSLSDYNKSRLNKAHAAKPSVLTASLKTSLSNGDDPKSASLLDSAGAVDAETTDKKTEPHGLTNGAAALPMSR